MDVCGIGVKICWADFGGDWFFVTEEEEVTAAAASIFGTF